MSRSACPSWGGRSGAYTCPRAPAWWGSGCTRWRRSLRPRPRCPPSVRPSPARELRTPVPPAASSAARSGYAWSGLRGSGVPVRAASGGHIVRRVMIRGRLSLDSILDVTQNVPTRQDRIVGHNGRQSEGRPAGRSRGGGVASGRRDDSSMQHVDRRRGTRGPAGGRSGVLPPPPGGEPDDVRAPPRSMTAALSARGPDARTGAVVACDDCTDLSRPCPPTGTAPAPTGDGLVPPGGRRDRPAGRQRPAPCWRAWSPRRGGRRRRARDELLARDPPARAPATAGPASAARRP